MPEVRLLNPQVESEVCGELIALVDRRLQQLQNTLMGQVLDRDLYLQTVGEAVAMTNLRAQMVAIYQKRFNK